MKKIYSLFLLLLLVTEFSAQNFSGKTDKDIAQLFLSTSNYGKDKKVAKEFNNNLLTYFNQGSEAEKGIMNIRYATIFKELYAVDKNTSFEFLMTSKNSYVEMVNFLTEEQRLFIKTKSRETIAGYSAGKVTPSTGSASTSENSPYNNRGFFANKFRDSDFEIYFPRATIYSNSSPIYSPRMQYLTSDVDTGFISYLYYLRNSFNGTGYVSVRFTPNIPSYHLLNEIPRTQSMAMIFTAINYLYPSEEYKKAKQGGGTYIIKSTVNPINWSSNYYLVVNGKTSIVAKAHRRLNGKEMIVQIITTNRTLKYENDLSSDEKYFLNDAVVNVSKY